MWRELRAKRWFLPVFAAALCFLEILILWFVLRGAWPGEPGAYELMATVNVTGLADILANAEAAGADPLYALLLFGMLRLLPGQAGHLAAPMLQMVLLLALWVLLFCLGRRLYRGDAVLLPPVLFCASASCVGALAEPEPTLLLLVLTAALALFYHSYLRRPIRTLSCIGLYLLYLAGILADFSWFFAALACCIPYSLAAQLRRRTSDAATAAVMLPAALVTAVVLHPALIGQIAALFEKGRFADGVYFAEVRGLVHGVSERLFGGGFLIAAILCVLLLIAAAIREAMRPKPRTEEEEAPAADPTHAAYQRRINRRKAGLPRRVTLTRAQVTTMLMLLASVLAVLLIPLSGEIHGMQALDSFWYLMLLGILHYAAPRLYPKWNLTVPVSILVCGVMMVISI